MTSAPNPELGERCSGCKALFATTVEERYQASYFCCRTGTLACLKRQLAAAKAELSTLRELEAVALERGLTPSLSNQVRLDEMCREMALAHRAKKATDANR